jgi:release factor glutamine methyltransferase
LAATIGELIFEGAEILRRAGVPEARRDAGSLMAHSLGQDRTFIISHSDEEVNDDVLHRFRHLLQRRSAGEPLQYITGHQEFFCLNFDVSPDVLIPRPETELLVETALNLIPPKTDSITMVDVGTGSGCITISLLHQRPGWRSVAIDLSPKAIAVAKHNARKHGVENRIDFVVADSLDGLIQQPIFDLIVSNPPYVAEDAMTGLQREVRDYEPRLALTPGGDGLRVIRKLVNQSGLMLKTGGYLVIEIGFDQRERVEELVDSSIWELIEIYQDLQGIPRTVTLRKHN